MRHTVVPSCDKRLSRADRRADRLSGRALLWDLSDVSRIRSCGRRGVLPDGALRVRASGSGDDRRAGFAGLATCGSVWSCPVCSERILAGRQVELHDAIAAWESRGGRVALLTLTMRHDRGQALGDLWDALSYGWNKVTSGRTWDRLNDSYGSPMERVVTSGARRGQTVTERRIGWARVVETTHGASGWHVHLHVALFLPGTATQDHAEDLAGSMFAAWRKALVRKGMRAPSDAHGVDVTLSDRSRLGDYFAKNTYSSDPARLALELARGDLKLARSGNRTPFRILADVAAYGLADDVALWGEWETASRGRRQLTWARGFRDLVLAQQERSDEELASEELGSADDDLVEVPAEGVALIARLRLHAAILDAAEADQHGGVLRAYLTARGVPWRDVRVFVG